MQLYLFSRSVKHPHIIVVANIVKLLPQSKARKGLWKNETFEKEMTKDFVQEKR